jgi:hypothetical protein
MCRAGALEHSFGFSQITLFDQQPETTLMNSTILRTLGRTILLSIGVVPIRAATLSAQEASRDPIRPATSSVSASIRDSASYFADSVAAFEAARRDVAARSPLTLSVAGATEREQPRVRDRYLFGNSGFYMSVSGGASMPSSTLERGGYDPGYNINVPIGYQKANRALGVRLDLGYSRLNNNTYVFATNADGEGMSIPANRPKIYSATLNMTARAPFKAFGVYGLAGAGWYQFRAFGPTTPIGVALDADQLAVRNAREARVRDAVGAQVGAGLDFGVGPASLFLESRFVNVFANGNDFFQRENYRNTNGIRWVPVVLGVTLR